MTIIQTNHTFEENGCLYRISLELLDDQMFDGGLRKIFREKLPEAQWTSVETGSTSLGVPDAEYCFPGGVQGWIEFKVTEANKVNISPQHVAWAEHRHRMGGRSFLIVRYKTAAGVRKGAADDLFVYQGIKTRDVMQNGLKTRPHSHWAGGPAKWSWEKLRIILTKGN